MTVETRDTQPRTRPRTRSRRSSPRGGYASTRTVFIGVGRPSTAAILARMVHNPDLVLVYESGTIGAKPFHIPLSIGDGELAETADAVVSVPEMFNYWIGPGRIDVAFLGAAQIDRYANLNSTVIGDYDHPKTRLPGAGGAPEIAASCGEVIVIAPPRQAHVRRAARLPHDRRPSATGRARASDLASAATGPTAVITDLGVLEPDSETRSLCSPQMHRGVDRRVRPRARHGLGAEGQRAAPHHRAADRGGARGAAGAARPMSAAAAYVLDAVRTPFGRYGGGLAEVRPDDLAAHVVKRACSTAPATSIPSGIDDVMFGDANQAGEDNRNVARMAGCLHSLPTSIPGSTVNRLCGSSLDAAMQASRMIETGDASIVLVGGVESMSRAPWILLKPERAFPAQQQELYSSTLGWRMVNPQHARAVDDLARRQRGEAGPDLQRQPRGPGRVRTAQPPQARRPRGIAASTASGSYR